MFLSKERIIIGEAFEIVSTIFEIYIYGESGIVYIGDLCECLGFLKFTFLADKPVTF